MTAETIRQRRTAARLERRDRREAEHEAQESKAG